MDLEKFFLFATMGANVALIAAIIKLPFGVAEIGYLLGAIAPNIDATPAVLAGVGLGAFLGVGVGVAYVHLLAPRIIIAWRRRRRGKKI